MTTSNNYPLTANQNAAIQALKAVQQIEKNNNFANGDLWNNIQDQIDSIETEARNAYLNADSIEYQRLNGIA